MAPLVPERPETVSLPWRDRRGETSVAFFGRSHGDPEEALAAIGEARLRHAMLRQVHSARVFPADPKVRHEGDGLWTTEVAIALLVVTADCVPVLLGDGHRIAALHAGWRGLAAGILEEGLGTFGPSAEKLVAWLGPSIGACCYEVSPEVVEAVVPGDATGFTRPGPRGRPLLDLTGVAVHRLRQRGVSDVRLVGRCTRCSPDLNSYRRDGPGGGRNLSFIWRHPVPAPDRREARPESPAPAG